MGEGRSEMRDTNSLHRHQQRFNISKIYIYRTIESNLNLQANSFFLTSNAIHLTAVFPIENSKPDGGKHMTLRALPMAAIADESFRNKPLIYWVCFYAN